MGARMTIGGILALAVLALGSTGAARAEVRVESAEERGRMQSFVADHVDRHDVVKSVRLGTDEFVDCVGIHAQPAMRRPELAGHVIEFAPRNLPFEPPNHAPPRGTVFDDDEGFVGSDHGSPESGREAICPQGTVPVRRLTIGELERFRNLSDFRKKIPSHMGVGDGVAARGGPPAEAAPRDGAMSLHQYAHAYQSVANWGGESNLNLWSPYVQRSNEFSLSQIWVVRGSGADRETVEAGWQVYRDKYGDSRARLFIYFTPDNYGSGGCYNLDCSAFVQTDNSIVIGGPWNTYSSVGGAQYAPKLLLYKDGYSGSWWLRYGDKWVGYWPRARFDANGLRDQGAKVDFGGEIIDRQVNSVHTSTDMGSGGFPSAGFGYAAYQRALRYVDLTRTYRIPSLTATRTDSYCYDIAMRTSSSTAWNPYFYFGGSGYNTNCK